MDLWRHASLLGMSRMLGLLVLRCCRTKLNPFPLPIPLWCCAASVEVGHLRVASRDQLSGNVKVQLHTNPCWVKLRHPSNWSGQQTIFLSYRRAAPNLSHPVSLLTRKGQKYPSAEAQVTLLGIRLFSRNSGITQWELMLINLSNLQNYKVGGITVVPVGLKFSNNWVLSSLPA